MATPNRSLDHATRARADFARALRRARRPGLLPYREALRGLAVAGESYRGVAAVPVDRIVGSTDRAGDFDRAFRPRRPHDAARWQRVAAAHHAGIELPPIKLYRVGDAYFVVDGHHRVSVARALGRAFVDAEVVEVRSRPADPLAAGPPAERPADGGAVRRRLGAVLVALGARLQGIPHAGPAAPASVGGATA